MICLRDAGGAQLRGCMNKFPPFILRRACNYGCVMVAMSCLSQGSGAELVVRDLIFDVDVLPADFDYSLDNGVVQRSGSDSFDRYIGIAFGARYSFADTGDTHGFLIGGQVTGAQGSYGSVGHMTDYGFRVDGGYGWAIADSWAVSAVARAGYGWATFDLTTNQQFSSLSLSGSVLSYGAVTALNYTVSERWQLSLQAGYYMSDYDLSGNGTDVTIERRGFLASIGFLYRLSHRPSPLE